MRLIWFLRMANWARNPPSARRVVLVFAVVAICLLLAGVEWFGLLPDGFGLRPSGGLPRFKPVP